MQTPRVVIAIVNYCTADLTINCLRSIHKLANEYADARVVIADNNSPDGSGQTIANAIEREGWSDWAAVRFQPRNGGFAYGNNQIIREWLDKDNCPEFFWLLNSDTIVHPEALTNLIEFLERNPAVGFAGSRLEHPDGTRQDSAFRFHNLFSEFESGAQVGLFTRLLQPWIVAPKREAKTQPVDWLSGASMMIRASLLRETGLLDEGYFLYYEETDLSKRAHALGWQSWYVNESRVIHLVGKSSGVTGTDRTLNRRPGYWFQSRTRYFRKNHGWLYAVAADLALIKGITLSKLRAIAMRSPQPHPQYILADLIRHSALLKTKS